MQKPYILCCHRAVIMEWHLEVACHKKAFIEWKAYKNWKNHFSLYTLWDTSTYNTSSEIKSIKWQFCIWKTSKLTANTAPTMTKPTTEEKKKTHQRYVFVSHNSSTFLSIVSVHKWIYYLQAVSRGDMLCGVITR